MASILIIEDDPIIALDIGLLVERMGHEVAGRASRTAQALTIAEARTVDLVLADVRLADGDDGLDAANRIRRSTGAAVVVITGNAADRLRSAALEPIAVLSKPFDRDGLWAAIDLALAEPARGGGVAAGAHGDGAPARPQQSAW